METPIVELKNILKIFPGVVALDDMSLAIRPGSIHGLIGENGAGKSTLIKVLTGVYRPDGGEIFFEGTRRTFAKPVDARDAGISCVYQELNIIPELSILDNLFLGNYQTKGGGRLDKAGMRKKAVEVLELLEQRFDPAITCDRLSVGQQQMIEIGKSIVMDAKLIILDEPTSSLGENETRNLFAIIKKLKEQGITFLFVSHKLEELFQMCDCVTVMRDAKHIVTSPIGTITEDELITHMVGRTIGNFYPKGESNPGEVALKVEGLSRLGEYYDVSFEARRGEILAFSGLVGAGRTELFLGIFGAAPSDAGSVWVNGERQSIREPHNAIANGLALLPENRKTQGLLLEFSVEWNLTAVVMDKMTRAGRLLKAKLSEMAQESVKRLNIKAASQKQLAAQLSGGNQQKVVIGKWVSSDADIYIFDEPTKGIDVGAKVEVYNIMNQLVAQNKCVIMISSELPEVLGVSDRVIVMRRGRVMEEIRRDSAKFNQEDIMKAAWGVN